jgi:hypothetical protein
MSNGFKITLLIITVVFVYLMFFYTVPSKESEIYTQAKEMIIENDMELNEAKFTNKGRYGEYMLHLKIQPKGSIKGAGG